MSTLQDVCDVHKVIEDQMVLFGATAEFRKEFLERYQAIGRDFCEHRGLEFGEVPNIDLKAAFLEPTTEKLFDEFRAWLRNAGAPV